MARRRFDGRALGGPSSHNVRELLDLAWSLNMRVENRRDTIIIWPEKGPMVSVHLTTLRSGPGLSAIKARIRRAANAC